MPMVTVVKENKDGGSHARGMEVARGLARGQQGGVKAQDEVRQDTKQLPSSGSAGARGNSTRKPW
jgi:hypothetical protein